MTDPHAPLRILLIAYEFPPSPSPQSLRWAYLARELHLLGHDLHVLTIDLGGSPRGLPGLPTGITIHRTHPGPVRGVVAWRRRSRERRASASATVAPASGTRAQPATPPSRSGWKHRLSVLLQGIGERIWFPDLRGEWRHIGEARLAELMQEVSPDVVISSHEPATTLELGLTVRGGAARWIADLGDPVLAAYTHPRWRERAAALEADVCRQADHILVTTPLAAELLRTRYPEVAPMTVLTQGFDDRRPLRPVSAPAGGPMELLYTGSFYRFRSAETLLQAVLATPGVRLNVATIHAPDSLLAAAAAHPDKVRLLGFLPHTSALDWQQRADVLVNLANLDPAQVPGKCYEYLGAGRPILHLGTDPRDAVAALVTARGRGWVCEPDTESVATRLRLLRRLFAAGRLDEGLSLDRNGVAEFGWSRLAARLAAVISPAANRS